MFNIGFLPRTWADPKQKILDLDYMGGDRPIHVVEIGARKHMIGEVTAVKVLGAFLLIQSDTKAAWYLITIDASDKFAERLNSIEDVDTVWPGLLDFIRTWWRFYHKNEENITPNKFGYDEPGRLAGPVGMIICGGASASSRSVGVWATKPSMGRSMPGTVL